MRLLPRRIRLRYQRPRLTEPKTKLTEQTLTLAHAQWDGVFSLDPCSQTLAVPQIDLHSGITGRCSQHTVHLPELRGSQAVRPAGSLSFCRPAQTLLLETAHPI